MRITWIAVLALAFTGCGPQYDASDIDGEVRTSSLAVLPFATYGHTPPPPVHKPPIREAPLAGPWGSLTTSFTASTMLLLTDGRLMVQAENDPSWWLLTPDATGSYVNGTWAQAASMSKARLYYCSAVLADGRVIVLGGEYTGGAGQTEDDTGEIYDPVANTWSPVTAPPGWSAIGDAACVVLNDGRLLLGSIMDSKSAIFDPKTGGWSDGGTMLAASDEESWVPLPDGSVVTVDCNSARQDQSELYVPGQGWIDAGKLPVGLVEASSEEIGPALRLPDGRVIFFGATGHTALYTPATTAGAVGTWAAGPDLPSDTGGQVVAKDTPAVLLANGHVLLSASSEGSSGWGGPTNFYDIDTTVSPMTVTTAQAPPNNSQAPYEGRMMVLPTGQVVYSQGSQQLAIMDPGVTSIVPAPVITSAPTTASAGKTFQLSGTGLTGVSATVAYGDDASTATSYPLVRLTNGANNAVTYARTHDHSTMAVGTGKTVETTMVTLPAALPDGTYAMQVVTNGVASKAVTLAVGNQSCAGCLDAQGNCQAGTSASACGTGGNSCVACPTGDSCTNGQCVAATCNGCRDSSGTCQAGNSNSACGSGGNACVACASNQSCSGGQCVTNSCSGCVDASGRCQPGNTVSACGAAGNVCAVCPSGDTCKSGKCSVVSTCSHALCSTGKKLAKSCDPCVAQICTADSYCCRNKWDSICVSEVTSICGRSCP